MKPEDKSATRIEEHPESLGKIERLLCRIFDHKVIVNCDRDPYLVRWYLIRRKNFALFLHKFVRSDEDRALHDHPWDFIVIPIWRGYIEHSARDMTQAELWDNFEHPYTGPTTVSIHRRVLPIISTRFRRGTYRHRVELLRRRTSTWCESPAGEWCGLREIELPSWSLFIRFREFRDWGFHMPEGWVKWNKFWQDKCE